MKRTINLPSYRIEEFTSPLISGESVTMYHLYADGNFIMSFASKNDLIETLNTRIKCELGVY